MFSFLSARRAYHGRLAANKLAMPFVDFLCGLSRDPLPAVLIPVALGSLSGLIVCPSAAIRLTLVDSIRTAVV